MVCLVVAVCNLFTIVPNDLTYDRLVKEVLQKSAITVYVAAVFCSMKTILKDFLRQLFFYIKIHLSEQKWVNAM